MAEQSAFVSEVMETLTPLGDFRLKRMFGGYGLFMDGGMFALMTRRDELFLMADEVNRDAFIAEDSGTRGRMPYYAAPPGSEGLGGDGALGTRRRRGGWPGKGEDKKEVEVGGWLSSLFYLSD
jgi:hypothetical protein